VKTTTTPAVKTTTTPPPVKTTTTVTPPKSTSTNAPAGGTTYKASFTHYGAGDTYGSPSCNTDTTACGFYDNPGYNVRLLSHAPLSPFTSLPHPIILTN